MQAPKRPRIAGEGAVLLGDNLRERHFPVDSNFAGCRLDRFLTLRLARLSRTKAGAIARHGDVTILPTRRRARPSLRLQLGETVVLRERLAPEWVQDHQVRRLYEDEAMIAVDKPAGMLVHESASVRLNTVQGWLERHGEPQAEPAHRLDRETSGVLICARSAPWVPKLRAQFASAHPSKIYRALALDAQGRWRLGERRTLCTPLGPISNQALSVRMGRGSLKATTHVEVLAEVEHERFGRMVDLQVRIETGRQHQIRVHLALEGTPVAGDKLYGQSDAFFKAISDAPEDEALLRTLPFARHALHAWRVRLEHPERGGAMELEAPLPERIWESG